MTLPDSLVPSAPAVSVKPRGDMRQLEATRELFWQNVLREILGGLAAMSAQGNQQDVFDGRLAVITRQGARIAIGSVVPLFACGVPGTSAERSLSTAVECTVFQIRTPEGEVFTLPLHEIVMFHSLSEELIERVQAASRSAEGDESSGEPFGFAAFTSLAKLRGTPPEGGIVGPGLPL